MTEDENLYSVYESKEEFDEDDDYEDDDDDDYEDEEDWDDYNDGDWDEEDG